VRSDDRYRSRCHWDAAVRSLRSDPQRCGLKDSKKFVVRRVGRGMAFYRFIYVIVSVSTFGGLSLWWTPPEAILYRLPPPWDMVAGLFQWLGMAGFLLLMGGFSGREFLGISQLRRWKRREYDIESGDELVDLNRAGFYGIVRHPMYFFVSLILISAPMMSLGRACWAM